MGKRTKIGIIYSYNEEWIGGTYYYLNLIQSLKLLPNKRQPHLVIIGAKNENFQAVKAIEYPYITFFFLRRDNSKLKWMMIKLAKKFNLKYRPKFKPIDNGIDVLFHPAEVQVPNKIKTHLYWIPDLQEAHLPELFSKAYLEERKKIQQKLLFPDKHILFSSEDAKRDFYKLYPQARAKTYVVNFSVFHPKFKNLNFNGLKDKYGIDDRAYFFSPNQFWKHKNHITVFKAIKELKKKGVDVLVLFSGKEYDHRNPNYFNELKQFVESNNLQDNIVFLGFIDRKEQLLLMDRAIAIIQPSLFEGWSSVVEDVKALNQNIIVSSLNVHKEQLLNNGYYFQPLDEEELSDKMMFFLNNNLPKPEFSYDKLQRSFGEEFIGVIENMN